ncbi:MAG: hypothetical protein K2X66_13835 [Cyanobacteria bacterium]|nr:hypothetical protein [Cyanobacteriota bacterium]
MAKTYRDFNSKAFMRKLGTDLLLEYTRINQHPLHQEFFDFLTGDNAEDNLNQKVLPALESPSNPRYEDDMTAFALINDMSCEKGFAQLVRICEQANLSHLITEETTSHKLAFEMYHHHNFFFNHAYTALNLDLMEGWQIYAGVGLSPLKSNLTEAHRDFKSDVVNALQRSGFGQDFHVDYYKDEDRLILDVRYSGPLIRQEDFKEGRITAKAVRKPLEIGLAYYKNSGVLKVKTPRGQETLNKSVHQAFAMNYLETPSALLETKTDRVINLDEFKTRKEFPREAEDLIKNIKVTGVRLCPFSGSPSKLTLRNKENIWTALQEFNIKIKQAEFYSIDIQFEFEGKGKSRFRTVEITSKNKATLNNSSKDETISKCLKRWGVMNV